ncbi:hypothetical protein [Halalkalicoccus salilacus]
MHEDRRRHRWDQGVRSLRIVESRNPRTAAGTLAVGGYRTDDAVASGGR